MGRLDGKVVLVTGAGQGIGQGIAFAVAAEGAHIVAAGRTLDKVEKTAEDVRARGVEALALQCDVRRRDDVDATVAASLERFGHLDGLVNNAQMVALGPVLDITEKDARRTWESGFLGSLWFMQAAYPAQKGPRASLDILRPGSAPRPGLPGSTLYPATKALTRPLTPMAALGGGTDGIQSEEPTSNLPSHS